MSADGIAEELAASRPARQTIDVKPLARLLGCDDNTLYRAISAGRLPAIRLSPRRVVVPLHVVDRLLAGELSLSSGKEEAPRSGVASMEAAGERTFRA